MNKSKKICTWYTIISAFYKDGSFEYWTDEFTEGKNTFNTLKEARQALKEIKEDYPQAVIVKETRQLIK